MKDQLLKLADELAEKLNQLSIHIITDADLKLIEEKMKLNLFLETKILEGIKTILDKENYVKEQLYGSSVYLDRKTNKALITKMEAEIEGLKYKFRAIKTILEVKE